MFAWQFSSLCRLVGVCELCLHFVALGMVHLSMPVVFIQKPNAFISLFTPNLCNNSVKSEYISKIWLCEIECKYMEKLSTMSSTPIAQTLAHPSNIFFYQSINSSNNKKWCPHLHRINSYFCCVVCTEKYHRKLQRQL